MSVHATSQAAADPLEPRPLLEGTHTDRTINDSLFDHVEKLAHGCIVQQNLTLITDLYRRPDVSYRLFGIGVNRFDGERWLELWADNQWGAIALSGKPEEGKAMVMTTLIPSRKRDLRLVWETQADGSVRTLQYVAPAGSGKWELYGDLIYRPNR